MGFKVLRIDLRVPLVATLVQCLSRFFQPARACIKCWTPTREQHLQSQRTPGLHSKAAPLSFS